MKKYASGFLLIVMCGVAVAQNDITITGTNRISRSLTPQQVIDSLEARFPDARSVAYYKIPADAASRGWEIDVNNNIDDHTTIEYYTIKFKRHDFQYYGLYKPDGTLVMSKYKETISHIPEPIKASLQQLSAQYPGYKVKSKTFYRNTNYSNSKEYYEFVASNGMDKKKVIYDGEGALVKVK
ncbi:MAG TPA: hypothetical protein VIM79_05680 [Niastella sp.]